MKHVAGVANLVGRRTTAEALSRVQSWGSGASASEQMRTKIVSIFSSTTRRKIDSLFVAFGVLRHGANCPASPKGAGGNAFCR